MKCKTMAALLTGALVAGVAGNSLAQDSDTEKLRAEMAQMRADIAQLRAEQKGEWSSEERKSEIEKVVKDMYGDASQRGGGGLLAGIDDKGKIFLKSASGDFTTQFSGQIQFRYLWNSMADTAARSDSRSGFQARRMKFGIKGTMGEKWGYKFVLATNRGTGPGGGNTFTEDAYITYDLGEGWSVLAGVNKLPFARQELISSTAQVAVDRSLVTEFFTLNRSDQATLNYKNDAIKFNLALSDGGNADFTGFGADASNDFAVTSRIEWMAMGDDWGAGKTEFAGVEEDALFLAAAAHYEVADGGGAAPVADAGLAWTLEALYKTGDVSFSTALFGNHTSNNGAADTDQYGLYLQGNYKIDSEYDVFARWEWIDDDGVAGAGVEQIQAITVGANKHFTKRIKLTGDLVWIYAGDNPAADGNAINGGELSSGLGLSGTGFAPGSGHDDQIAFRLQLQLLF